MFVSWKRRLSAAGVVVALLGGAELASAQNPPLGEVARKEQERRKTVQGKGKVITNKDLPPSAQKPASPAPPGAEPAERKPAEEARPESKDEKDEAWWRQRIMQARDSLRRSELFLEALQSRINALSADFVNRDDPAQRARIAEDRQKALAELDRVKTEITQQKQQIEEIEEEARKAGVPPGWLR